MVSIQKSQEYAGAAITYVGITRTFYGRPQYVLVNSDEGSTPSLKFPGLRFRAPLSRNQSLEDAAVDRFEEQTGLQIANRLGLRTVLQTRSRHTNRWIFRNVFFGVVEDLTPKSSPDGNRRVYLADAGQGTDLRRLGQVFEIGKSSEKTPLTWVKDDNRVVASLATDFLYTFDWKQNEGTWFRRIPCVGVEPLTSSLKRVLGEGLSVASMMLLYKPSELDSRKIILLQRKGDKYPGYGGGKIQTPESSSSNVDPISCCAQEGVEEYGFSIQPRALICCAATPLDGEGDATHYNSIVNYAFVAEPTNPNDVERALANPEKYLEHKMEGYVVEDLDAHRDRILRRELRMNDMVAIGEQFYRTTPGEKIPLTQILSSGAK